MTLLTIYILVPPLLMFTTTRFSVFFTMSLLAAMCVNSVFQVIDLAPHPHFTLMPAQSAPPSRPYSPPYTYINRYAQYFWCPTAWFSSVCYAFGTYFT